MPYKSGAGRDQGIAHLKHHKLYYSHRRLTMERTKKVTLLSWLGKMLGPSIRVERELETFARTEYGKDWRFAYQDMLDRYRATGRVGPVERKY